MKYLLFVLFSLFCHSLVGQHDSATPFRAYRFADSLFSKKETKVQLLSFQYPEGLEAIALKFQKAVAENREWAVNYMAKHYVPGQGAPYHENFGITREEYQRVKDIDKTTLVPYVKDSGIIEIKRKDHTIAFSTHKTLLKFMEWFTINEVSRNWRFMNEPFPPPKLITASDATPFGKWSGYKWSIEETNQIEGKEVQLDNLSTRIVQITLGTIAGSGKTLLLFKLHQIEKGVPKANAELACYLY